jgi:hypothetical protein
VIPFQVPPLIPVAPRLLPASVVMLEAAAAAGGGWSGTPSPAGSAQARRKVRTHTAGSLPHGPAVCKHTCLCVGGCGVGGGLSFHSSFFAAARHPDRPSAAAHTARATPLHAPLLPLCCFHLAGVEGVMIDGLTY